MLTPLIDYEAVALKLATQVHSNQVDKNGFPYILHCLRVRDHFVDPTARIIALLHDTFEDGTRKYVKRIKSIFSDDIIESVECLTHPIGEPLDAYYYRVLFNKWARLVKIADIMDNLDPMRMDMLSPGIKIRLKKKYLKALEYLL